MRNIIVAILVLLLSGAFLFRDDLTRLSVRLNRSALEDFAVAALDTCTGDSLSAQYGPWDAAVWKKADAVEFYISRSFAFGGIEKGFYYSADDTPISFNAVNTPLTEEEGGWRWEEEGNHGTTWRIQPCWFWFEAVL